MESINEADSSDAAIRGRTDALSLNKISLKGYRIHDNIILSNYENITHLEVSENNIEYLDLSTLRNLEILYCRRNKLSELTLNGESLLSLTASYNDLTKITISPIPSALTYVDIKCNKLKELPIWLDSCRHLKTLCANNNMIEDLPPFLFSSHWTTSLHTLHIANNRLTRLPTIPAERLSIQELHLQCNQLTHLPDNLFNALTELIVLNISNNKLELLPPYNENNSQIEKLFATRNHLTDLIFLSMMHLTQLRVLHAAYNNITNLPNTYIDNCSNLEEINLSGNKIEALPENISSLKRLRVLRLHSNRLQSIPDFSELTFLRTMDLANNQLGKIDLSSMLPPSIRFLDLSCNEQLQVDSYQLSSCQSQRKMSFVDVSGKNRFSLPTSDTLENQLNSYTPWKVGFSETTGNSKKLYISQLRLPNFCTTDGLFGMFDGEAKTTAVNLLPKIIPTIFLQHRTVKETTAEYIKYILISAYKELKQNDSNCGECAILCHIAKEIQCREFTMKPITSRKYILRAAMVGGTTAYLIRKQGPIHLPPSVPKAHFGDHPNSQQSVAGAATFEVYLSNDDEYLVIGSKRIWETMQIETIMQEIRSEENVILAAKRIQDIAQSHGAEENLSIIILKFQNVETYVDLLINELRQNVKRRKAQYNSSDYVSTGSDHLFGKQFCDQASPIGQMDQEISELNVCLKRIKSNTFCLAESGISTLQPNKLDNLTNGFQVLEEESEQNLNETDSVLSEEQFKCWEYMLEQNTQLLFDKELNKISNALTKSTSPANGKNINEEYNSKAFNLMHSADDEIAASCVPLLTEHPKDRNLIASKHFGSTRSFQQYSSIKTTSVNSTERTFPNSGANVGYFGSLQHIMPYNFESDFAVTHERQFGDESLEYATRMSQYWGVATTEL